MVVPVRAGGGMRVRILEAFAYAMPVVTTTVGLEGIHAVPGQDVLVANTPVDFADRASELLEDVTLQAKLATNSRKLAEAKYDWQVVLSAMRPIYE
jgi:glycosyltransferase involved in cell wall biosynthesis